MPITSPLISLPLRRLRRDCGAQEAFPRATDWTHGVVTAAQGVLKCLAPGNECSRCAAESGGAAGVTKARGLACCPHMVLLPEGPTTTSSFHSRPAPHTPAPVTSLWLSQGVKGARSFHRRFGGVRQGVVIALHQKATAQHLCDAAKGTVCASTVFARGSSENPHRDRCSDRAGGMFARCALHIHCAHCSTRSLCTLHGPSRTRCTVHRPCDTGLIATGHGHGAGHDTGLLRTRFRAGRPILNIVSFSHLQHVHVAHHLCTVSTDHTRVNMHETVHSAYMYAQCLQTHPGKRVCAQCLHICTQTCPRARAHARRRNPYN